MGLGNKHVLQKRPSQNQQEGRDTDAARRGDLGERIKECERGGEEKKSEIETGEGMNHIPVESSNVISIGYDGKSLQVLFRHGGMYEFKNVPKEEYEELMGSPSKGEFIHKRIKGKFESVKL
jgi:hypothetical protein